MKNKKVLTMMLLALMAGGAMGQSNIWNVPTILTDTTIVREWHYGEYIVYSRDGTNPGMFTYHDNLSNTVRTAPVPADVVINDFRIAHDTVYAGGSIGTGVNQRGYLACFAIQDLLNGSGNYYATVLPIVPMWMPANTLCPNFSDNYIVKGVTRLSLFKEAGGICVVYLSENVLTDPGDNSIIHYHRIGHGAVIHTPTVWVSRPYDYNKDGNEKYTDVAITDNHIVLAAWSDTTMLLSPGTHVQSLQVFSKTSAYVGYMPLYNTDRYYSTDHEVLGKVMITALEEDRVAVAYHYRSLSNSDVGLAVKLYDVAGGVPQLLHSVEIPTTYGTLIGWMIRDIRYDPQYQTLWVLHDMESPVTGLNSSYIYQIDIPNITLGIYKAHFLGSNYKRMYSLDNFETDGFITAGTVFADRSLFVFNERFSFEPSCGNTESVVGTITTPTIERTGHPQCPMFFELQGTPHSFSRTKKPATNLCNY